MRHYRDGDLVSRRHWIHNGWELLVQQRQNTDGSWETDFVTSGHNGEPQAIFNPQGEIRWQAPRTNLWGQRYTDNTESIDPGLAFAGQCRDAESSLCYNRFRYYDPSGGCYISPDPIGIAGGENLYAYVKNPVSWVDPLGLAGCSVTRDKANKLLDSGEVKVTVKSRSDAEQLFMDRYLGSGYKNMTGESGPSTKNIMEYLTGNKTKSGTYHWDDVMDSNNKNRVMGHGPNNPDGDLSHLKIREFDGNVIHIFSPW